MDFTLPCFPSSPPPSHFFPLLFSFSLSLSLSLFRLHSFFPLNVFLTQSISYPINLSPLLHPLPPPPHSLSLSLSLSPSICLSISINSPSLYFSTPFHSHLSPSSCYIHIPPLPLSLSTSQLGQTPAASRATTKTGMTSTSLYPMSVVGASSTTIRHMTTGLSPSCSNPSVRRSSIRDEEGSGFSGLQLLAIMDIGMFVTC